MACLNLPFSICYKPENMYIVGIINGPREPQLLAINHYMWPLVDDLALSWQRGVWFSKTAMCPSGCTTRSAVATTVCDLPGACKAAQLASHGSHNYCSVYFETWKRHDTQEMHRIAVQWRDAPTNKDQEMLFSEHGIRWSELWCLPYWDPTQQLVVDSMHCILERVVQGHIQVLLLHPIYGSNRETQEQGLDMLRENLLKHTT
ncbi:hypothetical protein K439DRAFT_1650101 [Ramaria rubella]|nr:hypothetical protein K439DRAFT_1650101 [Ramaria rubella]